MRLRLAHAHTPVTVHSISTARTSVRDDQSLRIRNYVMSMGIRTACFILSGFFAMVPNWTVAAWICVVAAVVLPYPAVVFANATNNRKSHFMEPMTPVREIGTPEDQVRSPGAYESW